MFQRLTNPDLVEVARKEIGEIIEAHVEWFYLAGEGTAQPLRRSELQVSAPHGQLILSCWTEKGTRSWRILAWGWDGARLALEASGNMGAPHLLIELIPRAAASAIASTIRAARQVRCDRLAQLACALEPGTTVERSALSPGIRRGQPGRYGRIVMRRRRNRIAVTGSVATSRPGEVDAFLSSALLWFIRTTERARPPYFDQLWLVVEEHLVKPALQRLALLSSSLQEIIRIHTVDDGLSGLRQLSIPARAGLWRRRLPRFPPINESQFSSLAAAIQAHAPEAIDVVQARHGETLRYHGLPFARVRRVASGAGLWFGLESRRRRLFDENTSEEWDSLFKDLVEHRSAKALDHHHALYRAAAEAWLESLLRRDITRLDSGLIIAPLHAQFRTARPGKLGVRPVDLLALRQDGRLVVIELKVAEDREHVLQGVDYWQRVEAHRRRGHIAAAQLFGSLEIRDEPPLVYLVAPTLRVHPSFQTLAHCVTPDIEIYRFDINEDWRKGVCVMRRLRVN